MLGKQDSGEVGGFPTGIAGGAGHQADIQHFICADEQVLLYVSKEGGEGTFEGVLYLRWNKGEEGTSGSVRVKTEYIKVR